MHTHTYAHTCIRQRGRADAATHMHNTEAYLLPAKHHKEILWVEYREQVQAILPESLQVPAAQQAGRSDTV